MSILTYSNAKIIFIVITRVCRNHRQHGELVPCSYPESLRERSKHPRRKYKRRKLHFSLNPFFSYITVSFRPIMSDEEDDYMSDAFLSKM